MFLWYFLLINVSKLSDFYSPSYSSFKTHSKWSKYSNTLLDSAIPLNYFVGDTIIVLWCWQSNKDVKGSPF